MRLELLSRPSCHLCDEMRAALDQVLGPRGMTYREIDVDSDGALQRRFGETVPVLLRDGKPVAKVRLTRRQLERIVQRRR